ncbi:colicin D domain-containing protein [Duganella sp. sic0402]|uniref:colicin D domain-containing protein n=1 Tax=Duganella sp. sic0402 TaxID=2854786 RepID=UPI0035A3BC19
MIINNRHLYFSHRQLRHAYKHAHCLGIAGQASNVTLDAFRLALTRHVQSLDTRLVQGSFRGIPVTHFVNFRTGLNVMRDSRGYFLSVWILSAVQMMHMVNGGKLGGGV